MAWAGWAWAGGAGVAAEGTGTSRAVAPFDVGWTNGILTISRADLPGGQVRVLYLEAFLRSGANRREWGKSRWPHKTELLGRDQGGARLKFHTKVEPNVEMWHEVRAGKDEIDLTFRIKNRGKEAVDLQWFQPACIRVAEFAGRDQRTYTGRSFIYTDRGLTILDETRRTTDALYLGGQVYVPEFISPADANPRPICLDRPVNGLIGCFSSDDRWILATASDRTHEVFEGVYVCLHSDPHVGGLKAGETKRLRSKIYLMPNDPDALLKRYRRDFGGSKRW